MIWANLGTLGSELGSQSRELEGRNRELGAEDWPGPYWAKFIQVGPEMTTRWALKGH